MKLAAASLRPTSISHTHTCRSLLLGTATGAVLELQIDEKDKRDRAPKQVFQMPGPPEPIYGLCQHAWSGDRLLVLLATPSQLSVYTGKGTAETLFESYAANPGR